MVPEPTSPSAQCCALTASVEDYLKAVFVLPTRGDEATISTVAEELGVTAASASAMMKRLVTDELVVRVGTRGLALTSHGRRHALAVVRRHRLLETFLVQALDMTWDEVHAEAEVLEHVLSERLEARIDAALGHPRHDPHGDPIPPREGGHDEGWPDPLDAAPAGCAFRVERVSDRDSDALRHLDDLGVRPGTILRVERRDPFAGPLWVFVDGAHHALGAGLTRLVYGTAVTEDRG